MSQQQDLIIQTPAPPPAIVDLSQPAPTIEHVLLAAVQQGASIETLERISAMIEKAQAAAAKREYLAALAKFQAVMPAVKKEKKVKNKDKTTTRFMYAPIEDILPLAREHLAANDLSVDTGGHIAKIEGVLCYVGIAYAHHSGGHTETREFPVPIILSEYMTDQQSYASASSFAERYAVKKVLGIVTKGDDDEALLNSDVPITRSQAADLQSLLEEVKQDKVKFLQYMSRQARRQLKAIEEIPAALHQNAVEALEEKRNGKK